MDTPASNLNVFKALTSSLSFCGEFAKKHWIITVLYTAVGIWTAFLMKNKTDPSEVLELMVNPTFDLMAILGLLLSFFLLYYSLRMSFSNLEPTGQLSGKSWLTAIWQVLCLQIIILAASVPLFLLLVLPHIWWLIKTSVAGVNLFCTNDGPIQSIKKSFQLTENNFWQAFGYLSGVVFLLVVVAYLISIPASIALHASLMPDWDTKSIMQAVQAFMGVFLNIIYSYCQTWLYVYLRAKHQAPVSYT